MANQELTIIIEPSNGTLLFEPFLKVTTRTVGILRGIDREASPEHTHSTQWSIGKVSMKSPLSLTLVGIPIKEREDARVDIASAFVEDINRLEKGTRPKYLTETMEQKAKSLVSSLSDGIGRIRFQSNGVEAQPTQHLAANVDEALKAYAPHYEIGSVEGILDVLSVKGHDMVEIRDSRHGIDVTCRVSESQLEEAKDKLRKRVMVRGRIKYKQKKPRMVMDVFCIRELLDSRHAPQPEDIGAVDLTGGTDPVDYLRGEY